MVSLRIAWLSIGWLIRATTLGFDEESASNLIRLLEPTTARRLISDCSPGSFELRRGGFLRLNTHFDLRPGIPLPIIVSPHCLWTLP